MSIVSVGNEGGHCVVVLRFVNNAIASRAMSNATLDAASIASLGVVGAAAVPESQTQNLGGGGGPGSGLVAGCIVAGLIGTVLCVYVYRAVSRRTQRTSVMFQYHSDHAASSEMSLPMHELDETTNQSQSTH